MGQCGSPSRGCCTASARNSGTTGGKVWRRVRRVLQADPGLPRAARVSSGVVAPARRPGTLSPRWVMNDWSPLEDDVLLTGTLTVVVRGRRDGRPRTGVRVAV